MTTRTAVSEIMTKDVFVLNANDTVMEIERTFRNHHLRHAPVTSDGELVGMLSLVDVKRREHAEDLEEIDQNQLSPAESLKIRQIMTPDPVSVQGHTAIHEVATIFMENEFHALPVLDGERIVGIVSTTDIIRFLLEQSSSDS